jgi:transposase
MEEVLDVYEKPYDVANPVVCFDERPCFLIADEISVIPAKPGQLERFDYTYKKCGAANVFGVFEPLQGRREMQVTERRTMPDFAQAMKQLVDVFYPSAERITVVLDNLATHTKAALYATFTPEEAHRLARKLHFVHTPKHGSWLNMVEIEFAALAKQCLDRHIPDIALLEQEVTAWTTQRNHLKATVNWHFTTNDARIKLQKLYPSNLSG